MHIDTEERLSSLFSEVTCIRGVSTRGEHRMLSGLLLPYETPIRLSAGAYNMCFVLILATDRRAMCCKVTPMPFSTWLLEYDSYHPRLLGHHPLLQRSPRTGPDEVSGGIRQPELLENLLMSEKLHLTLRTSLVLAFLMFVACDRNDPQEPVQPAQPAPAVTALPAVPAIPGPLAEQLQPLQPRSALVHSTAWVPTPLLSGTIPKGTLRVGVKSLPYMKGFPSACFDGCIEATLMAGISETLFIPAFGPQGLGVRPQLAETFALTPDMSGMTFALKQSVPFQDDWGLMSADDVAWTLTRLTGVSIGDALQHPLGPELERTMDVVHVVNDHKLQVSFGQRDHRWPLAVFSSYRDSVPVYSQRYEQRRGTVAMAASPAGVGPYMVDRWTSSVAELEAFVDYHDPAWAERPARVHWFAVPEREAREALLLTLSVQIAEMDSQAIPELLSEPSESFATSVGPALSRIYTLSFDGNLWERGYEAMPSTSLWQYPWVGNPYEWGSSYHDNTPSMRRARDIRNALSMLIDRNLMLEDILGGVGWMAHQPYLSAIHEGFRQELAWPYDPALAVVLLERAGLSRKGTNSLSAVIRHGPDPRDKAIADWLVSAWRHGFAKGAHLHFWYDLEQIPDLAGLRLRSESPALTINGCAQESAAHLPLDWPLGRSLSILGSNDDTASGQELPYATEAYTRISTGDTLMRRRSEALAFHTENRRQANCIGLVEEQIKPVYNQNFVTGWQPNPVAHFTFGGINALHTLRLLPSPFAYE